MTTTELMQLPNIGVKHAAKYLQNGTTEDDIRVGAQAGACPFCKALRTEGSKRYHYRIILGELIKAKWPDGYPLD